MYISQVKVYGHSLAVDLIIYSRLYVLFFGNIYTNFLSFWNIKYQTCQIKLAQIIILTLESIMIWTELGLTETSHPASYPVVRQIKFGREMELVFYFIEVSYIYALTIIFIGISFSL